jgi:hypothetical protein
MTRFKNHLIAAAVLSVLAIVGTIMNSHQAAAQPPGPPGGLAVNVVQSIPLQVTGSTAITGTANVNVTNPATAPVPTSAQPGGPLTNLGRLASELVVLQLTSSPSPTCQEWFRVFPDGTFQCFTSVPAGLALVVTDLEWDGLGTAGDVAKAAVGYAVSGGGVPPFGTFYLTAAGTVGGMGTCSEART